MVRFTYGMLTSMKPGPQATAGPTVPHMRGGMRGLGAAYSVNVNAPSMPVVPSPPSLPSPSAAVAQSNASFSWIHPATPQTAPALNVMTAAPALMYASQAPAMTLAPSQAAALPVSTPVGPTPAANTFLSQSTVSAATKKLANVASAGKAAKAFTPFMTNAQPVAPAPVAASSGFAFPGGVAGMAAAALVGLLLLKKFAGKKSAPAAA